MGHLLRRALASAAPVNASAAKLRSERDKLAVSLRKKTPVVPYLVVDQTNNRLYLKRGDEKLLLQFPQRCPGLRRDVTLLYEKGDTSRICEHDTVQARLDLGVASRWGPRCILPAFESVTAQQIEYLKAELRRRPPAEEKPQASEATGSGT